MESPLVSVIIPVYNGENVIGPALESVLTQSYGNLEVIVVDDCSKDNSRKVIDSYKDPRIKKLFLDKNLNLCRSSNLGFSQATGKYITTLGHDDLWHVDKIKKQVEYMESEPDVSLCFTKVEIIDEHNNIASDYWIGLYDIFDVDNLSRYEWLYEMLTGGNRFCAPSAMFRKDVGDLVGYYRNSLIQLQDYDLWVRFLLKGGIHVIEERLTYYRRCIENGASLSTTSIETSNRERHEYYYIVRDNINSMDDGLFIEVFKDRLHSGSPNDKEIKCEKALLLTELKNPLAYLDLLPLFDDEDTSNYLEEACKFTLSDFYTFNTAPLRLDDTYYSLFLQQKDLINSIQGNLKQDK